MATNKAQGQVERSIIRVAARDAGMSIREVALAAGMSVSTLRHKLAGVGAPFTVAELRRLASALGLRASELLDVDEAVAV